MHGSQVLKYEIILGDIYLHSYLTKYENVNRAAHICILTPPNVIWRCSIKWEIGWLCEGEPKSWLYGDRECRLLQIIQMGHLASQKKLHKNSVQLKIEIDPIL